MLMVVRPWRKGSERFDHRGNLQAADDDAGVKVVRALLIDSAFKRPSETSCSTTPGMSSARARPAVVARPFRAGDSTRYRLIVGRTIRETWIRLAATSSAKTSNGATVYPHPAATSCFLVARPSASNGTCSFRRCFAHASSILRRSACGCVGRMRGMAPSCFRGIVSFEVSLSPGGPTRTRSTAQRGCDLPPGISTVSIRNLRIDLT
jgi:hypothetical protein